MCLWGHVLIKKMSVGMVKKRATNIIRKIHRINKFLPLKLKLTLYNTLIVPIFNYADIIWGGCYKKQAKRLQVSQNFAVRSILGRGKWKTPPTPTGIGLNRSSAKTTCTLHASRKDSSY